MNHSSRPAADRTTLHSAMRRSVAMLQWAARTAEELRDQSLSDDLAQLVWEMMRIESCVLQRRPVTRGHAWVCPHCGQTTIPVVLSD